MSYALMIAERISKYANWEVCIAVLEESGTITDLVERTGLSRQNVQTAVRELVSVDVLRRSRGGKHTTVMATQPELLHHLIMAAHQLALVTATERAEQSRRQAESFKNQAGHWGIGS
jgi:predicted transcriptional regulator